MQNMIHSVSISVSAPVFLCVLLTRSLQWISLLCVCLLSHCSGRQMCLTPEATSVCLCLCVSESILRCAFSSRFNVCEYCCASLCNVQRQLKWQQFLTASSSCLSKFQCGIPKACWVVYYKSPLLRAVMVTVFHNLLCGAGIHPDRSNICQHVTY